MNRSVANHASALPWLLLSLLVIALDQLTKYIVLQALEPYVPQPVIPGLLNWTLAFNTGAAFSFLHDQAGWQRWLFSLLAVAVSAMLVRWLSKMSRGDWRNALPVALVIGGALGNLIDRVRAGQVTDFIEVYFRAWSFPAFNVADSAITVGAILLLWFGLLGHAEKKAG
ncbi:MAG: signal peptidase II [Rudaea sp.]